MSSRSHKLRKQMKQRSIQKSKDEQRRLEKFIWFKAILIAINVMIALLFWTCRNLSIFPTAAIILYEIILIIVSLSSFKKIALRKYIGWWNLIVPFTAGILWRDYWFYNNQETLLSFGKPGLLILGASFCISGLVVLMTKELYKPLKARALVLPIVIALIAFSASGHIIKINDMFGRGEISIETYKITKKYEESINTPFTHYHLCANMDENHSLDVEVEKESYKKTAVGDTFSIPVYEGLWRLKYLKRVEIIVANQIEDRSK